MRNISILGVTGSVGQQALDIAREFKDKIQLVAMTAHKDMKNLAQAANEFRPKILAITDDKQSVESLRSLLDYNPKIIVGAGALESIVTATSTDMVLLAVLGIAGLPAFVECLHQNIDVALANKESLVCGADIVQEKIDNSESSIIPVDSEHSAIFQCLGDSFDLTNVSKLWLTASGGPFLDLSKEEIENAPIASALKHPNWDMGQKITIDSASMANKGLEVIEAHYMYKAPADMIEVVIQPQSLIHSMVEMVDASVLAQFAPVDMRLPLQKAMLFPDMYEFTVNKPLNFKKLGTIEFVEPDLERFPCLQLAYDAIRSDTTAVYNIANEMAVEFYLQEKIRFGQISEMIEESMSFFRGERISSIADILELDQAVRQFIIKKY